MKPVLIATLLAGLVWVAPAQGQEAEHLATRGGISIIHAWTRAGDAGTDALVFMDIDNAGPADRLLGARTEMASDVHIVGLALSGGDVAVTEVGPMDIATGDLHLDPGGLAFELYDLTAPLVEGEHFAMVVEFATAGEVTIEVEIEAAGATQHSHAGHGH